MIARLSPYVLIQETLVHDEFLILVSCVMLNQTSRKQVEKIFKQFVERYPAPEALARADLNELSSLIKPLGFYNRRARTLIRLAQAYISKPWKSVRELPGIGEYAAQAHQILWQNILGDEEPKDGALKVYWHWAKRAKTL